ncbi:MAG: diiron oxygenase [Candidatus Dormibacteraeota bacterium]|uniref:Diiron oxygenase n=1 Tax=Candidatus Amunia macphersoniae TaxID=3127014 RepID=A0A934KK30_9BACT|nr:diiron oxygenase [Candidatus Dormibacteraeota bacterium]
MTTTTSVAATALDAVSREAMAQRLIRASAQKSFDPEVDVEWAQPPASDLFYMPEHRVSLYGTRIWERMTRQQRIDLSRHEIASTASVGIWFELILLQLLARHIYDLSPTSDHVRYALVEIGDECRHSVMFSRFIEKLGCPAYGPGKAAHALGRFLKTTASGPEVFAAILIAEEILDTLQRELMTDESVQPLVRRISQIHVIEEARHVRYAHDELQRQMAGASPLAREWARWVTARSALVISSRLIHPDAYAAVGLDPLEARRAALSSPIRRDTMRWAASRLVTFFGGLDLLGGPGMVLWRRSGLIG